MHPHLDCASAGEIWDDLEYKEYSYNEPSKDLPLKIFEAMLKIISLQSRKPMCNTDDTDRKKEAPPPYGKRIVTINIETEGSDKVSVIFAGRIYEYRDRFQECL